MSNQLSFRYFKTSPEIIQLAVMLYVRFPLSLRNVEDLLHERGGDVSYESVWHKWLAGQVNHLRNLDCLAILPHSVVFEMRHDQSISALPFSLTAPVISLGLMSRRGRLLAPIAKLMRHHFVAEFGVIKGLIERHERRVLWSNSASSL